jgi:hypothetical protein
VEGTEEASIHPSVAPKPGEPVFVKRRVGAFSSTDLESVLRANGVDTVVLLGFSTSGVILSTYCWAADRDFRVVVVDDLCADGECGSGASSLLLTRDDCSRRGSAPGAHWQGVPAARPRVAGPRDRWGMTHTHAQSHSTRGRGAPR